MSLGTIIGLIEWSPATRKKYLHLKYVKQEEEYETRMLPCSSSSDYCMYNKSKKAAV